MVFHAACAESKTKGVSILLSRSLSFILTDQLLDPEGRFIFLKVTWKNRPVTLANIYWTNSKQVPFLQGTLLKVQTFQSGLLILWGDFSLALNPLLDTTSGASSLPFLALHQVKCQQASLVLHDTWWTINPSEQDYTFFSSPHKRYLRLDYLFVHQSALSYLHGTTIDGTDGAFRPPPSHSDLVLPWQGGLPQDLENGHVPSCRPWGSGQYQTTYWGIISS